MYKVQAPHTTKSHFHLPTIAQRCWFGSCLKKMVEAVKRCWEKVIGSIQAFFGFNKKNPSPLQKLSSPELKLAQGNIDSFSRENRNEKPFDLKPEISLPEVTDASLPTIFFLEPAAEPIVSEKVPEKDGTKCLYTTDSKQLPFIPFKIPSNNETNENDIQPLRNILMNQEFVEEVPLNFCSERRLLPRGKAHGEDKSFVEKSPLPETDSLGDFDSPLLPCLILLKGPTSQTQDNLASKAFQRTLSKKGSLLGDNDQFSRLATALFPEVLSFLDRDSIRDVFALSKGFYQNKVLKRIMKYRQNVEGRFHLPCYKERLIQFDGDIKLASKESKTKLFSSIKEMDIHLNEALYPCLDLLCKLLNEGRFPVLRGMILRCFGTDQFIQLIQNCPSLQEVCLFYDQITKRGLDALAEHCPSLRILELYSNVSFSAQDLSRYLQKSPSVNELNFMNCSTISGDILLEAFCNRPSLKKVQFGNQHLTPTLLHLLGDYLPELISLRVHSCHGFTPGELIAGLMKIKKISVLELHAPAEFIRAFIALSNTKLPDFDVRFTFRTIEEYITLSRKKK